jgi:hypothetical protein
MSNEDTYLHQISKFVIPGRVLFDSRPVIGMAWYNVDSNLKGTKIPNICLIQVIFVDADLTLMNSRPGTPQKAIQLRDPSAIY